MGNLIIRIKSARRNTLFHVSVIPSSTRSKDGSKSSLSASFSIRHVLFFFFSLSTTQRQLLFPCSIYTNHHHHQLCCFLPLCRTQLLFSFPPVPFPLCWALHAHFIIASPSCVKHRLSNTDLHELERHRQRRKKRRKKRKKERQENNNNNTKKKQAFFFSFF